MADRRRKIVLFGIAATVTILMLVAVVLPLVAPVLNDHRATRAARHFIARGTLLVPAVRSADLRGDEQRDYWCFSDGTCFYPIDRFRWFYPAYNDLDDTILLRERALSSG
jgi:hypothetical protein